MVVSKGLVETAKPEERWEWWSQKLRINETTTLTTETNLQDILYVSILLNNKNSVKLDFS
ncbi:hypothetical protein ACQCT5_11060 [Sutcliffiella halmapala]